MPSALVYSTSARHIDWGWAALDLDVLRTFRDADSRSFASVVGSLPAGLHFAVVSGSLAVLVDLGYLARRSEVGPWELTDAGRGRLAELATARAAA